MGPHDRPTTRPPGWCAALFVFDFFIGRLILVHPVAPRSRALRSSVTDVHACVYIYTCDASRGDRDDDGDGGDDEDGGAPGASWMRWRRGDGASEQGGDRRSAVRDGDGARCIGRGARGWG